MNKAAYWQWMTRYWGSRSADGFDPIYLSIPEPPDFGVDYLTIYSADNDQQLTTDGAGNLLIVWGGEAVGDRGIFNAFRIEIE
jgi:hypothetical protein